MRKVVKEIPLDTLIDRMKTMYVGDVIGLAQYGDDDGYKGMWYGIEKIDLSKIDTGTDYWVIQCFGGFDLPKIVSNYGEYFESLLREALNELNLLNYDCVWIDNNDLKGENNG